MATAPHRQIVQVADHEPMAQIGLYRSVVLVHRVRILHKRADVPVGVAQVVGESVGGQQVETIGKVPVQRSLERVVEGVKLRVIQRQNYAQVRQYTEVWPTHVAGSVGEIRIQRQIGLVQVA